jgi:hypothetical protein
MSLKQPLMRLLLTLAVAMTAAACEAPPPAPDEAGPAALRIVGTETGADWTLPEDVRPAPATGLFTMDDAERYPEIAHQGYTLTWAELNPADGAYDWSPISERLDRARKDGHALVFRLKANVTARRSPWGDLQAVPGWLLDKARPATVAMVDDGPEERIEVAVPWDQKVQAAHLRFIEAFGRQGFQNDPQFLGLYVHGISSSFGEEFWANAGAMARLTGAGMTPERLEQAFTQRLDAWAAAFGDQAGKLAWVGAEWFDAPDGMFERYRDMAGRLNRHAATLGMGRRWGHIEDYNGFLDLGTQEVAADGRQFVKASHPLLADHRFFGAENENYDEKADEASLRRNRFAVLRALQLRMRMLWVEPAMIAADPEIARYFNLGAGKSAAAAPDAFAVLFEADIKHHGKRVTLRNIERYLRQVDAEGATTRSARKTARARFFNDWQDAADWTARRTALEEGQQRMAFEVDSAFLDASSNGVMTIKVTWIDQGAVWRLTAGEQASGWVPGVGDGHEKTTTFTLPAPALAAAKGFSLDARQADLLVSVVRLVK